MKSALSIPERCLVFGIFLLPFDNFVMDVGVLVPPSLAVCLAGCLAVILNRLLGGPRVTVRRSRPNFCLLSFVWVALFTSIVGAYRLQNLGTLELYGGILRSSGFRWCVILIKLGLFIAVYFLFSAYGSKRRFALACHNAILISSLVVCVYGFYQLLGSSRGWPFILYSRDPTGGEIRTSIAYAGDLPRMQSFAQEPKGLAEFLWVAIIVAIFARYSRDILSGHRRLVSGILAISVVALMLTFSRSGWAVLLLSLPAIAFLLGKVGNSANRVGTIVLIVSCIALAVGSAALLGKEISGLDVASDRLVSSTEMLSEKYLPFTNLMYALSLLPQHYLTGIGLGNFAFYLKNAYPGIKTVYSLHNMYLSIWLKTGIVGLLTTLLFILSSLHLAYGRLKAARDSFVKWSIGLSLALAIAMSLSCIYGGGPSFLYFVLFGLLNGVAHLEETQEPAACGSGSEAMVP